MKIGVLQFAPLLGNLDATLDSITRLAQGANGVELLVLPELCNSGYNFESSQQAWETSEPVDDSRFISFLVAQCKKLDLHIVSGFNERDGQQLFNSSVLVGPSGYVGRYRKLHLFMNEKDHFQPGNAGLPVFDLGFCTIGMLVCFDWMFPEVWRILALRGADIICHPSNLVLPGLAQRAVPTHAVTNRVYTATCNRIGTEGNLTFTGLSTIAGPGGDVLSQATAEDEALLVIDIELDQARNKWITPRNHVLEDRRPEEYAALI